MDDPRDDALELLQRAWGELPTPPAHRDLEDEDDTTRAAVSWARDAFAALEPPAPVQRLRPVSRPRAARPSTWRRHAAAAAVLLSLALALRSRPEGGVAVPIPEPTDVGPRLVAVADDQVVMRSGPVRLVLITSTDPAP